jgi:hypothetical protein
MANPQRLPQTSDGRFEHGLGRMGIPAQRRAPVARWHDRAGFCERLEVVGFGELGVVMSSDEKRAALLGLLDGLFATGLRDDRQAARCRHRFGADQHPARALRARKVI